MDINRTIIDEEAKGFQSHALSVSDDERSTQDSRQAKIERKALLKVDLSVLLLLVLGLIVFQLNRMNLGSALTDGFEKAIHIDQKTVNLGNQLLFMAIVVFEIPLNMALMKVGPRGWMAGQVIVFGFMATMQIFIKNRAGFLATRVFLGLAEGGYIPGGSYIISTFYPERERARRQAIFFFGMFGGNALSPILASGILRLGGTDGLYGWKWLFLIEGCFTISIGLSFLFSLPGSIDELKPLIGPGLFRWTEQEMEVLRRRVRVDGYEKTGFPKISFKTVWATVSYYRRWPHYVQSFAAFSTWASLTTYTPSIIKSLGFDRTSANALAAVGAGLALPVVYIFGVISDRTKKRGATVIAALVCYLITLVVARTVFPHVHNKWSRWGLWTAVNAFAVGYHPISNTWVQLNCRDAAERSIAIAMWVMCSISGLMAGTQYFQPSDAPFYHRGLMINAIMVSVSIVASIVQISVYAWWNRRYKEGDVDEDGRPVMRYNI